MKGERDNKVDWWLVVRDHPFSVANHSIHLLWLAQLGIAILILYQSTMLIGLAFHNHVTMQPVRDNWVD